MSDRPTKPSDQTKDVGPAPKPKPNPNLQRDAIEKTGEKRRAETPKPNTADKHLPNVELGSFKDSQKPQPKPQAAEPAARPAAKPIQRDFSPKPQAPGATAAAVKEYKASNPQAVQQAKGQSAQIAKGNTQAPPQQSQRPGK